MEDPGAGEKKESGNDAKEEEHGRRGDCIPATRGCDQDCIGRRCDRAVLPGLHKGFRIGRPGAWFDDCSTTTAECIVRLGLSTALGTEWQINHQDIQVILLFGKKKKGFFPDPGIFLNAANRFHV